MFPGQEKKVAFGERTTQNTERCLFFQIFILSSLLYKDLSSSLFFTMLPYFPLFGSSNDLLVLG